MGENSTGGFNIGDLLGGGKGLEVLADLIKGTFGTVTRSYFIRKDAVAKADELRLLGEAEAEVYERKALAQANAMRILAEGIRDAGPGTGGIKIEEGGTTISTLPASEEDRMPALPITELINRSDRRNMYQNLVRQQNVESVTSIAAEQLIDESEVSTDPVDPDWISRFFRYTEDISDEKMQFIWGRILAGEVKKPNSYSLRTLQIIRNLAPDEASLFNRYSERVILDDNRTFILLSVDFYEQILINDLNKLEESGLISPTELTKVLPKIREKDARVTLEADEIVMVITIPIESNLSLNSFIKYYQLTIAGAEIYRLSGTKPNMDGFFSVGKKAKSLGLNVAVGPVFSRDKNGRVDQMSPTINIDDV